MANSNGYIYQRRRWDVFINTYRHSQRLQEALSELSTASYTPKQKKSIVTGICRRLNIPIECVPAIIKYADNPKLKKSGYLKLVLPPVSLVGSIGDSTLLSINAGVNKTEFKELVDFMWPTISAKMQTKNNVSALNKRVASPKTDQEVNADKMTKFLKLLGHTSTQIAEFLSDMGYGQYEPSNIRTRLSRDNKKPIKIPRL